MFKGFQKNETEIPGCLRISPRVQHDERGSFVKVFHPDAYPLPGDESTYVEEFYSISRQRVLRGLHFQRPPAETAKLIHCVSGLVMDVVVDLRCGSPTCGQHEVFELSGERADMLFIPAGLAHGFYVLARKPFCCTRPRGRTRRSTIRAFTGPLRGLPGPTWSQRSPIAIDDSSRSPSFRVLSFSRNVHDWRCGGESCLGDGRHWIRGGRVDPAVIGRGLVGSRRSSSPVESACLRDLGNRITVHAYEGTVQSLAAAARATGGGVVFHLASLFLAAHTPQDVEPLFAGNILFGTHLVEAMVAGQAFRMVTTGTYWQHYGNADYSPVCLYAATKQAFETVLRYYCEATPLKVVNLVLYDAYGPGDERPKLFRFLRSAAEQQRPCEMSPGDQLLDLVYIDDVVDAYLCAAERCLGPAAEPWEEYAVSSGAPIKLREVCANLCLRGQPALAVDLGRKALSRPRSDGSLEPRSPAARLETENRTRRRHTRHGGPRGMSIESLPLVSVCIPVYNGACFIGRAIESVLAQTLSDFELIVIDNHSQDENVCRCPPSRGSSPAHCAERIEHRGRGQLEQSHRLGPRQVRQDPLCRRLPVPHMPGAAGVRFREQPAAADCIGRMQPGHRGRLRAASHDCAVSRERPENTVARP